MISPTLLSKIGLPIAFIAIGFVAGLTFQSKVLERPCPSVECPEIKVPKCPDCNCPPTLGNEFDRIKTKGKSNLTLNLHNNYTTACDSTSLRETIRESVQAALDDYTIKKKKR